MVEIVLQRPGGLAGSLPGGEAGQAVA